MMGDCASDRTMTSAGSFGSLKIRKDVSVASWDVEKGLAEVTVRKGKLWCGMGVMRSSKLYCNVEEAVYLVGLGSLVLLHDGRIMSMDEVYSLLVTSAHGCSWVAYQTFAYLKRLGYIVGRHGVPWTTSRKRENLTSVKMTVDGNQPLDAEEQINALESMDGLDSGEISTPPENLDDADRESNSIMKGTESSIMSDHRSQEEMLRMEAAVSTFETMRPDFPWADAKDNVDILQKLSYLTLNQEEDAPDTLLMYDVFLPNGRFKKSSPGSPAFQLCISSGQPPTHSEVRSLELNNGGVPLKFALVESGHVSIFSFDTVDLPDLP